MGPPPFFSVFSPGDSTAAEAAVPWGWRSGAVATARRMFARVVGWCGWEVSAARLSGGRVPREARNEYFGQQRGEWPPFVLRELLGSAVPWRVCRWRPRSSRRRGLKTHAHLPKHTYHTQRARSAGPRTNILQGRQETTRRFVSWIRRFG